MEATAKTMIPVIQPALKYPWLGCNALNSGITITASEPRAMFGTVVATVARIFVPNCSAAIVTNMAQNPVPKPRTTHAQYMVLGGAPCRWKNQTTPITVMMLKIQSDIFLLLN